MSDTLFLLDMLRLSNEKKLREQKDAKILDMAMEKKRKMEEAKKTGSISYSYNSGGFVGVNQLTKNQGSKNKHQYSRKSRDNEEEDASSVKTGQDSEMIILGLFREQRQEELYKDRVNQISEESLGCVSDQKCLKRFEN